MAERILSVEEVYFLVRVGSWGQEELAKWLADSIEASYTEAEEPIDYYDEEEEEWKLVDDDEC